MTVTVSIDCREEHLISTLKLETLKKECGHIVFNIEQLDIGDIIYKNDDKIICLIERKTIEDYIASIVDGRSKNQSIRIRQLKKENENIKIIYLIEGNQSLKEYKFRGGVSRDSLYSSFINRVIKDNFTIYRTEDIVDTCLIFAKIYDKLVENLSQSENIKDETLEYLKTIKLAKKENMTPTNCFLCQLSQIPGVSIDVAKIISNVYPTMYNLIIKYSQLLNEDDKDNMLSELKIPIANNKHKRLGKVLSKRIYEFLCKQTQETSENIQKKQQNSNKQQCKQKPSVTLKCLL